MSATVMLVEDDSFTRITVAGALREAGVDVIRECSNAAEALAAVREYRPDVGVLDLDLGRGPTGVDVATAIRRVHPSIGIVFLTSFADPRLLNPALNTLPDGACYLVKQSLTDLQLLTTAIDSSLTIRKRPAEIPAHHELTPTQIEILRLVAMGLTNNEISRVRSLEPKSVEKAIARTARSLGIESDPHSNQRVALAREYYRLVGAIRSHGNT
jgi:DNA-binding NarL/FixJ family response regulator